MTEPVPAFPATGCEACGSTEGTAYYPLPAPLHGEYICPRCARSRVMVAAARAHLAALLEEAAQTWARHWIQATATVDDLAEAWDWLHESEAGRPAPERRARVQGLLEGTPTD